MGNVYKAEDTRLRRFVALKFLPEAVSKDRHALEIFEREAIAASALNHPNIINVHGIDQQEGVDFIVTEYVTGKTLDEMIPRKGMNLGGAFKYAVQIAVTLSRPQAGGSAFKILSAQKAVQNTLTNHRGSSSRSLCGQDEKKLI